MNDLNRFQAILEQNASFGTEETVEFDESKFERSVSRFRPKTKTEVKYLCYHKSYGFLSRGNTKVFTDDVNEAELWKSRQKAARRGLGYRSWKSDVARNSLIFYPVKVVSTISI